MENEWFLVNYKKEKTMHFPCVYPNTIGHVAFQIVSTSARCEPRLNDVETMLARFGMLSGNRANIGVS